MTPIFVALLEPLVLVQPYSVSIVFGASLAATGGYVTLAETRHPLAPLTRLTDPGPLFAVMSAAFLAIGAVAVPFVVSSMPLGLFVLINFAIMTGGFGVVLWHRGNVPATDHLLGRRYLLLGAATAATQILIFTAIDLTSASHATIMFRLATIFNVLIRYRVLQEKHIAYRLLGSLLIIAGVIAAI